MRELIFDIQRFVSNRNSNSLVSGTSDNDCIENYGNSVTIDGGAGSDSIDNYGNSVKADGGGDNDTLVNGRYWESAAAPMFHCSAGAATIQS